jgi:hypothetical protein
MLRRRGWLGAFVTALVLGSIGGYAIWQSLSLSTNPDYQLRNERAGVGEYFLNVWVDPQPVETGEVEVSVQFTSIIGTTFEPSSIWLDLHDPVGNATRVDLYHVMDPGVQEHTYSGTTHLDQPGEWELIVHYSFGGPEHSARISVPVGSD